MAKGDIVLIVFPFTDLSGSKLRPAIILAESTLDVTVCFITTQLNLKEATDVPLVPSTTNGLKRQSLIKTSKIATIDRLLARGLLGKLDAYELTALNTSLKIVLQL